METYIYNQYVFLKNPKNLKKEEKELINACIKLVRDDYTLRPLSKDSNLSVNKIWRFIHDGRLESISPGGLYIDCIHQLDYNKKYKTGRHNHGKNV